MSRNNKHHAKPRVVAGVKSGQSLEQVSRSAGVSPATVAKWRKRDRRFDQQILAAKRVDCREQSPIAPGTFDSADWKNSALYSALHTDTQSRHDEEERVALKLGEILPDEQLARVGQVNDLAANRDPQMMRWNMGDASQEWLELASYQESIRDNWRILYPGNRQAADEWDNMELMSRLIGDAMQEVSEQRTVPPEVRTSRAPVWTGYALGLQEHADREELPGGMVAVHKQLRAQAAAAEQLAAYWRSVCS